MEYLSLPFALKKGYLRHCDIAESIAHSVGLILSTRLGNLKFDRDFGCSIWEKEYSDLYSANKSDIRANLRNAISKYEKRLSNANVTFVDVEDAAPHAIGMIAKVTGKYHDGKSDKRFEVNYNLG